MPQIRTQSHLSTVDLLRQGLNLRGIEAMNAAIVSDRM